MTVYNQRHRGVPEDAVYVGRPGPFGNPFTVEALGRADAVEAYRIWIHGPKQADLRARIRRELRGRDLVCWCTPAACHGDVIDQIANAADESEAR